MYGKDNERDACEKPKQDAIKNPSITEPPVQIQYRQPWQDWHSERQPGQRPQSGNRNKSIYMKHETLLPTYSLLAARTTSTHQDLHFRRHEGQSRRNGIASCSGIPLIKCTCIQAVSADATPSVYVLRCTRAQRPTIASVTPEPCTLSHVREGLSAPAPSLRRTFQAAAVLHTRSTRSRFPPLHHQRRPPLSAAKRSLHPLQGQNRPQWIVFHLLVLLVFFLGYLRPWSAFLNRVLA